MIRVPAPMRMHPAIDFGVNFSWRISAAITSAMTMEEKAFARAVHAYFNGQSRDRVNQVSEKLKGYSIARVEHYFPINTDTSFTKTDFEAIKKDGSIEGMGWTKERINAATPILLRDLDAVLLRWYSLCSSSVLHSRIARF